MAKEIERKFKIIDSSFIDMAESCSHIKQAYLSTRREATVRVRIKDVSAYLTIKGITTGCSRDEWEYPLPLSDAEEMISNCSEGNIIDKTRYIVIFNGHRWEIDVFHGVHEGLIIGEIELSSENEPFDRPSFIGEEVTGDPRYYNSSLAISTLK